MTFDAELEKLRELTTKLTENGYLIDRAAQWEFAFDAVPDYVFIVNPEYKIKYINKSMVDVLGKGRAEVFNLDCCDLIRKKGADSCLCRMEPDLKKSIVVEELYLEDGIKGWFHFTRSPIYDESEELLGVVGVLRDITSRKQTEEALKISETKYSELYNASPDMYVSVDAKTALVKQCNDTLLSRLGYTREEVMGEEIFKLYHEDCMDKVHESFKIFTTVGKLEQVELQLKRKDGTPVDVSLSVSAVCGEDGNILYSSSTWRDITKKKKIQKALQESEERFRLLSEASFEGVTILEDNVIIDINDQFANMIGDKPSEIIGKEVFNFVAPESRDKVAENIRSNYEGVYEHFALKKNGSTLQVEVQGKTIPHEGRSIRMTAIRDITERKLAEKEAQKLAAVAKYTNELINLATLDGKMIFLNEAGREMLGIDPDEVERTNIMEVIPEHQRELVQNELLPALTQGKTWEGELQYRNVKTGKLINTHARTFAIQDPDTEKPLFLANISMDITVRKQMDRALRESEEKYRNVYKTAPLAFVIWDLNARVVDWNIQAEELFGWSREEIIGRNFFDFIILEEDQKHVKNIVDDLLNGTLINHSINRNITKEGKIITCEWNNSALHDDDGNIIGAMSLGLDLSPDRIDEICKR